MTIKKTDDSSTRVYKANLLSGQSGKAVDHWRDRRFAEVRKYHGKVVSWSETREVDKSDPGRANFTLTVVYE